MHHPRVLCNVNSGVLVEMGPLVQTKAQSKSLEITPTCMHKGTLHTTQKNPAELQSPILDLVTL